MVMVVNTAVDIVFMVYVTKKLGSVNMAVHQEELELIVAKVCDKGHLNQSCYLSNNLTC